MNGLQGSESSFHEKFHFALITESCHDAANTSWIRPRQQCSTSFNKRTFQFHLLLKTMRDGLSHSLRQIPSLRLWGHDIKNTILQWWSIRGVRFYDWES